MQPTTAVLLAAGANSRFFPFNTRIHKSGYQLLGRSLIERTLDGLHKAGIKSVVIVESPRDHEHHNLQQQVDQFVDKLEIKFVVQHQPKGMGDALLQAKNFLREQFVVLFPYAIEAGTILTQLTEQTQSDGAICIAPTKEPWRYGIVSMEKDRITGIVEKPERGTEPSNFKAQGIYVLNTEFLQYLQQEPPAEYNFEAALNTFCREKQVLAITQQTGLPSLKYPWHFFDFQTHLFQSLESLTAESASVDESAILDDSHGPIVIEENVKIQSHVKIVGPCFIGKNSFIGDYSFIRESSIEQATTIGAKTEIVRSIIFPKVSIHLGYIADSIIGSEAKIAADFITANKRYDRQPVKMQIKHKKVATGKKALGMFMGEGVETGIGVKTMPGICIGANSQIYPGLTLYENIPHNSRVIPQPNPSYTIESKE